MFARKKVDATQGPILKLIFMYSIPLILTTIAQNLFNIADKAVLGNMAGSTAVAAIGATGVITELIINGAVGLSTGTSIVLARFIGQKNEQSVRSTIDTSLLTSVTLGVVLAILGFFFSPFFLTVTDCPIECYDGALIYIRIFISAAPFTLLYNYGAAILRTMGDTQRPLTYILIAGVVNVVLNIILCLILPQKVAAVAIATIASKIISSLLVLRRLCKIDDYTRVRLSKMRFNFGAFGRILRFGIPVSISNLLYPFANLQIVPAINSFGVDAIAGNSAAASVNSIVMAFTAGFASATTTFVGQNLGAKNPERVKKSFFYSAMVNIAIGGSLGALLFFSGRFWIGLIVGAGATAAIDYGMQRMLYLSLFMFVNATNRSFSGALQAFGYPFLTSISNIIFTLGFRVIWMQFIYPQNPTFAMIECCFTVSWSLNMLFYGIFFCFVFYRYVKKGICKKI